MTRLFSGDTLVVATHNTGKLTEFRGLLAPYVKNILASGELRLPEPEETGATFQENAALKALAAAKASGFPSLADDSGLCVNALGGNPGLYSARWAGPEKDFVKAMTRVHRELDEIEDRSAYFISVLVLAWPDGHVETVEGRCDGTIIWPMRGTGGHGYDPVFQPQGEERTFAEMTLEEKQQISHRAKALRALAKLFGHA